MSRRRAVVRLAVVADGSVYVADRDNQRIRRVLDGLVATVAKDGYVLAVEGGPNPEGPWRQGSGEAAFTEVVPVAPGQQVRFDLDLSVLDQ